MLYEPNYADSHALVIGINKYRHVSPLEYARNDAEAISALLVDKFDFPKGNITLLVDKDASGAAIRSAFLNYSRLDGDDRVLFFFAGHGHTVTARVRETGFLVPVDGKADDLSTLIRWDELTRNAELVPAKHVLFLMDACYGGLALMRKAPKPGSARFFKNMLQRYSRQVITAGKADEVVADAGGPRMGHSIFTGHLLDAMEGAAATTEGIVTANSVMAYVYEKVGNDPHSQQTPHFGFVDGDGDFIFNANGFDEVDENQIEGRDILVQVVAAGQDRAEGDKSIAETLKDFLPAPTQQIRLDDFVSAHVRAAMQNLNPEKFPIPGNFSKEEFEGQVQKYELAVGDLRTIAILLARWANTEQQNLLERIFLRLAEIEKSGSGLTVYLGLSWHPIQLLMYASGIAALSANKADLLRTVFLTRVREEHRTGVPDTPLIIPVTDGVIRTIDGFRLLPGHERHLVPRSEYLFKFLQPEIEDSLFLGRSYETYFDEFEVIWALVYGLHPVRLTPA